jgi:N-acetylmuramoyl-L-alanine amidase
VAARLVAVLAVMMVAVVGASGAAATPQPAATRTVTVVLDPGHDLIANLGLEPIGPGSGIRKIKDGGGTSGVITHQREAVVNLRIALRMRTLLKAAGGIRVKMTRTKTCCVSRGNVWRANFANGADAALFLRIHADGSTNHAIAGTSTLYPANRRGWTSDIFGRSRQAAKIIQARLVKRLGWPNRGIVPRSDITGFNWSNRPVVLTEVGFLTNPGEDRALKTAAVVNRAAAGLRDGVLAYLHARGLR